MSKHGPRRRWQPTYSIISKLLADPDAPMPEARRRHQLLRMHQGLHALITSAQPVADDWRVVSDAVNLLETIIAMGHARDESGLLRDAVAALAVAGARHVDHGKPIRLGGAGIQAIRAVLEDYREALDTLPARIIVETHRRTEMRVRDILQGKKRAGDVAIVEVGG